MKNYLEEIENYESKFHKEIRGSDWLYAFQCCGDPESHNPTNLGVYNSPQVSAALNSSVHTQPFQRKDIKTVFQVRDGDNDGPNWIGLFELFDGRFAFLSAGCDYTGWDCQSSGYAIVSHSLEHLWQFGLSESDRAELDNAVIQEIIE